MTDKHPKRASQTPCQNISLIRRYAIGKGHSVSVLWRGGEVDMIYGFEKEADALEWIKGKSQEWLLASKS